MADRRKKSEQVNTPFLNLEHSLKLERNMKPYWDNVPTVARVFLKALNSIDQPTGYAISLELEKHDS